MIATFRKLYPLLDRQARRQLVVLGAMVVMAVALESVSVGLVFPFIKVVSEPEWLWSFAVFQRGAALLGIERGSNLTVLVGAGVLAVFTLKTLYVVVNYYVQYSIVYGNAARYATAMLRGYAHMPHALMAQRNSAELLRNVRETPQVLFNAVAGLVTGISEGLVALMLAGILLATEPMATVIAAVILGPLTVMVVRVTGRHLARLGAQRVTLASNEIRSINQTFGGLRESRILGRENFFVAVFAAYRAQMFTNLRRSQTLSQLPRLVIETFFMIGMIVITLVVAARGDTAALMPKLGLFAAAAFRLLPSVNRINMGLTEFRVSAAEVDVLHTDWRPDANGEARRTYLTMTEEVRLDGLTYRYPQSDRAAVENVSLRLGRGESIGLVGLSGSGKSTLVDLLLGLLEPEQGQVTVDGSMIDHRTGRWLGGVGYVPQSIYILDDTIRRNIAFGVADEDIDDAAVRRALDMARLAPFVASLPDGLDTVLNENGARLSGGQRQRIGIARALYHDPEILIFDEATSALDVLTESEITEAIRDLHGHKTIIVIAHRLVTVRHCDRIILMENGHIAAAADFDTLARESAAFRRLVEASGMGNPL
jgi:ATP-binding cassette subfamily C protein